MRTSDIEFVFTFLIFLLFRVSLHLYFRKMNTSVRHQYRVFPVGKKRRESSRMINSTFFPYNSFSVVYQINVDLWHPCESITISGRKRVTSDITSVNHFYCFLVCLFVCLFVRLSFCLVLLVYFYSKVIHRRPMFTQAALCTFCFVLEWSIC